MDALDFDGHINILLLKDRIAELEAKINDLVLAVASAPTLLVAVTQVRAIAAQSTFNK